MDISKKIDYKNGIGEGYGWLGYLNAEKGNLPVAIDFNLKSLELAQSLGLESDYPVILNNLGTLNIDLGKNEKALQYFTRCAALNKKQKKQLSLSTNYHNIGLVHFNLRHYDQSIQYYLKALIIRIELGDKEKLATPTAVSDLFTKTWTASIVHLITA